MSVLPRMERFPSVVSDFPRKGPSAIVTESSIQRQWNGTDGYGVTIFTGAGAWISCEAFMTQFWRTTFIRTCKSKRRCRDTGFHRDADESAENARRPSSRTRSIDRARTRIFTGCFRNRGAIAVEK